MRASQFHLFTLKGSPSDAEVVSQKLMLRAGMIRKVAAGIYSYMPMGLRAIRKVETIVREEMDRAGAMELIMPMVQPAELWTRPGAGTRWATSMLRFKDRHERDFDAADREEVVTDIARQELQSYRQLPKNFYQIQTKFRDERIGRASASCAGASSLMKDAVLLRPQRGSRRAATDLMFAAYTRASSTASA